MIERQLFAEGYAKDDICLAAVFGTKETRLLAKTTVQPKNPSVIFGNLSCLIKKTKS